MKIQVRRKRVLPRRRWVQPPEAPCRSWCRPRWFRRPRRRGTRRKGWFPSAQSAGCRASRRSRWNSRCPSRTVLPSLPQERGVRQAREGREAIQQLRWYSPVGILPAAGMAMGFTRSLRKKGDASLTRAMSALAKPLQKIKKIWMKRLAK